MKYSLMVLMGILSVLSVQPAATSEEAQTEAVSRDPAPPGHGGVNNSVTGTNAYIGGGDSNTASGPLSTIGAGVRNTASGAVTSIGGGAHNAAAATASTIAGGRGNSAAGVYSAIGGGAFNEVTAQFGVVGGGGDTNPANANVVTDDWGTVSGGHDNRAGDDNGSPGDAPYATVSGGRGNEAGDSGATVGGGSFNRATGTDSVVGGGTGNIAGYSWSTVGGGDFNLALDDHAVVAGGFSNAASGFSSAITGGLVNQAGGTGSFVGGGFDNNADGWYSAVSGGGSNRATGYAATIPGGKSNLAEGRYSFAAGRNAKIAPAHDGAILFSDSLINNFDSAAPNEFAARATGGVRFVTAVDGAGNPTAGVTLGPGGTSWGMISDRNAKENFETVDVREVVDKLAAMSIQQWNYRHQDADIRHIGPVAQDFHAAFGLNGEYQGTITVQDAEGVALAAIQGLNLKLEEKAVELHALETKNEFLEARIERLETMLSTLITGR